MSAEGSARGNARVALICAAVAVVMVGMAFAAVPFYRVFCQATGFNGAVRRASFAPGAVSSQSVTVSFDTNVRGLSWTFTPDQRSQEARLGEPKLAFFRVTNTGGAAVTGRALFNVTPESAGPYFSKLECFCFKNQTLKPGETAEFPVVYFVDPRYAADKDAMAAGPITLSYTFFPAVTGPRLAGGTASGAVEAAARPLGGAARAGL
ncbi:MAG TPA: cytochrome c oxidase assembly protein [Caulobacteraceae bacterium]|jgi:cytochrome c oxidase assembly protein subunit 11